MAHALLAPTPVAAIHLTLCEIGTANHLSYPLECDSFNPNAITVPGPLVPDRSNNRSRCVEYAHTLAIANTFHSDMIYRALSRSAQFWSSYSGYLREIREVSPYSI
jgi:hypothetical protein